MEGDPFAAVAARMQVISEHGAPPSGALMTGVSRIGAGGAVQAAVFGCAGPSGPPVSDPGLRLRVASVTKLAVARTARAAGLAPTRPLADFLQWPDQVTTIGHLMSHTSGLTDATGYVLPPPADVVATALSGRSGHEPGTYFRYANINYVLLGMAIEHATQQRLDRLVADLVLTPAGIGGGLNWAGVTDRDRRQTLYRWDGRAHVQTMDGRQGDWTADVIWRDGEGRSLSDWRPGFAPLMSPQGGLRASVVELARLARFALGDALGSDMAQPLWRFDGRNGLDGGGLFRAMGQGVVIYDDHPLIPGDLVGHAGQALGAATGAWLDRRTGAAWGYAMVGGQEPPEDAEDEVFYPPAELAVMRAIAQG